MLNRANTDTAQILAKQTDDSRFAKRVFNTSMLCLIAILCYSCRQSAVPTEIQQAIKQKDHIDAEQKNEMPLDPQDLLNMKLANPHQELSARQSISLINHCAQLGEQNTASAAGREVVMVMGITGAGKSTTINALMGCQMEADVDIDNLNEEIIIVAPESPLAEVMPIGHGQQSLTFLPQIAPDPNHTHRAYCDCPGFSENRGPEINIANAININRVSQHSAGVKVVFLTSQQDLFSSRGSNIRAMETMCRQLFGSVDNIRIHQDAVLLGITKAPIYRRTGQPFSLNAVRTMLTRANNPTAHILANRIFLFDPLDRGSDNPDFWSIERCRNEIARLKSIPQQEATNLFQTVLTSSDQTKLKLILRDQATALAAALEQDDYPAAGNHWQSLSRLMVIGNQEIEQMIREHALSRVQHHALECANVFRTHTLQYHFEEAERQLALLRMLTSHLPNADLQINLVELESLFTQCKEKQAEEQRNTNQQLETVEREALQKVRQEIEQKIQQMLAQLENGLAQLDISENERQRIRTSADEVRTGVLNGIVNN